MKKQKIQFYTLNNILKKKAHYYVIFGKRSNGKTYAALERMIKRYFESGIEGAYIRRNAEDFRKKNGDTLFENHVFNGLVEKYSKGVWNDVVYTGRKWYFSRKDGESRVTEEKPFCYGFALSGYVHDKSTSYPRVKTIVFDEFITRGGYIPDEFMLFMHTLSTITRNRTDVEIFMLGNTINKYCPYFSEMGLTNIRNMEIGTIDVYRYGTSDLKVAVEYTASNTGSTGKDNVLFAFNNPKLQMITHGSWEIDIYPHLPYRYKDSDIIFTYFIEFDGEILQCEIIKGGTEEDGERINAPITYIHRKTTKIRYPHKDVVFTPEASPFYNHYTRITKPIDKRSERILLYFKKDKVFYQDNETGEIVNNYLMWCK